MVTNIIIPARDGSKGIKQKNLALIGGIPLFQRSINHALALGKYLPIKVWITTDIGFILNSKIENDNIVFHKRPKNLCGDKILTYDVVLDLIDSYRIPEEELIILFQPTTPFRDELEVLGAIKDLENQAYFKSAVSLNDVGGNHPFRMKRLNKTGETIDYIDQGFENMLPRQQLPKVYIRSGSFYIAKVKHIKSAETLLPKPTKGVIHKDSKMVVNIDNPIDLVIANELSR